MNKFIFLKSHFKTIVSAISLVFLVCLYSNDAYAIIPISDTQYYSIDTSKSTATDIYIQVPLYPQDAIITNPDYENYVSLRNSLQAADSNEQYTLHILLTKKTSNGGNSNIFPIGFSDDTKYSGTLNIRSMTEIDLNGYTLLSTQEMMNTNLFCNSDKNGFRHTANAGYKVAGGYSLSHNISLKNGTIDGNKNTKTESNLITFGHANNITITNINFTHNASNHLLEFNGCKDVITSNCTFDGFLFVKDKSDEYDDDEYISKEAIELDISSKEYSDKWSGAYDGDNTVCQNITISDCTFKEYPCGIGAHHTIMDNGNSLHMNNIVIKNNSFTYSNPEISGCAIRTYSFDNCTITGNKINGNYYIPIRVYGGNNVDVSQNTITKAVADGIITSNVTITYKKTVEYATNVMLNSNKINATGRGIYTYNKSSINSISGNTIVSQNTAISIADTKKVDSIKENNCTSKSASGLSICSSSVNSITNNIFNGYARGLYIAEGSVVTTIGGSTKQKNTITSTTNDGICITDKNTNVTNITYNSINEKNSSKGIGVRISASAIINNLSNNKIYAPNTSTGFGISNSSGQITTIDNNKINAGYRGIVVTGSSGKVSNITGNTITAKKDSAVYVASGGKIKKIGGSKNAKNTIKSSNKDTIIVSGKSSKINELSYNTISSPAKSTVSTIKIASLGAIDTIKNNTIDTSGKKGGIGINVFSGNINLISKNTIKAGFRGIIVTNKSKVKNIRSNTIAATNGNAIIVSSGGNINTIGGKSSYKNTLSSTKKEGIFVFGKGSKVNIISYNEITAKNKSAGFGIRTYNAGIIKKITSNKINAKKKKIYKQK